MRTAVPVRFDSEDVVVWLMGVDADVVGNGKVDADEERSGDLGDLRMVAYREPSNGPWVC